MIPIGERIRNRRLELGMTQEELALKTGYKTRVSINKLELGRDGRTLKMSKIPLFAKALQVPIEELMGWNDDPDVQIGMALAEEEEFIIKFKQLNPSNQAAVRTMVDALLLQQSDNKT